MALESRTPSLTGRMTSDGVTRVTCKSRVQVGPPFAVERLYFTCCSGAPLWEILEAGQWASPAFLKYLDLNKLDEDLVIQVALVGWLVSMCLAHACWSCRRIWMSLTGRMNLCGALATQLLSPDLVHMLHKKWFAMGVSFVPCAGPWVCIGCACTCIWCWS